MRKCILVMDMPSRCSDCKLKSTVCGVSNVTHCCNLANGMITLDKGFEERLPNCPLKPMPSKKESQKFNPYEMNMIEHNQGYRKGYNACIDEILGGGE